MKYKKLSRKLLPLALAVILFGAGLLPVGHTSAGGQVTDRSIQMSDSSPSATSVSYRISFKPTSTTPIGGIVVDICADTPIVGNTNCTYPANFSWGGATPTASAPTGIGVGGSWVATNSMQGGAGAAARQVFKYTNTTPQTPTGTSTPIVFAVSSVTNSSSTASFYARIVTFDTSANAIATYTTPTGTTRNTLANITAGGMLDYGGVALDIVDYKVPVSATIMETLSFCISSATPGASCSSGVSQPTVILGSGTPPVIDSLSVYNNTVGATIKSYMQLSTNALTGASVSMKSGWACNGLSRDIGGSCGIAGNTTATPIAAGSGQFGLYVAAGGGGTGTLQAVGNYATAGTYYSGANVTSTYGDPIANTNNLPCNSMTSQLNFAATAASTTPAGIYTVNESLIATGIY